MAALTPEICFRTNPLATDFHTIPEFKVATQRPKELHPAVGVSLFQGEGQNHLLIDQFVTIKTT